MSKKTILIVDDTFENLYLLKVILEEAGYNIIEANDGVEGLKKLNEVKHVDLIISDILMPNMDGYLFCQACRKEEMFAKIPFVFYTSTYTEKLDEDFALKLGAASFLRKPIDHDEVINTVNFIFKTKTAQVVTKAEKENITEGEVFKLYNERLISKLEQKSLNLSAEIEERKKAEQLLIHKNEILDLIAINTPLNKIFEKLLLNYEVVHPNYFGSISLLDEDGIHLNFVAGPSLPKIYNTKLKRFAIGENAGSCGTAAFFKEPVIVSDISKDKLWVNYKEIAAESNLKSCWSIPILSEDNLVKGTFAIYSRSVNTPSLAEIRELNFAVSLANIAIEKFRAAEEIKKKEESYKALINQASDAIIAFSLDGTIYEFNKAVYVNLGYTKKEFLKLNIKDFIVGEVIDNPKIYEKIQNKEHVIFVRELRCKDKSIIEVEVSAKLQKDGKVLAIVRDITERQNILKEIKKEKEFSSGLLESMREGLYAINLESEIISVNPSFCKMTGFTERELLGLKRPYPFSPPELKTKNDERYLLLTQNKNESNYENIYMHKDGTRFPVQVRVASIHDHNGAKIANFATIQNITERKKAANDLKRSKEFTEKLIMSMQEGLIILDMNGKIKLVNDSFCKILGYTEEELIGLSMPYPFAREEDYKEIANIDKKIANGEAPAFQFEFIRKNGETFLASFLIGHIKNNKGTRIALFGTLKDISEEEKAKQILINKAKKSNLKKEVILELAGLVGKDFSISLKKITKLAAKTLNVERVSIWVLNDDNSTIKCENLYVLDKNSYEKGTVLNYADNPNYFNALNKNKTILVKDAQKDNITKLFKTNYLKPNNITSLMDVFINSANGYYGIICFEHVGDTLRNWTAEDQEFATSIASIVSLMVESNERKIVENEIALTNAKLTEVNAELSSLQKQLEEENVYLRNELDLVFNYEEMVYGSLEFSNVLSEVEKVAPTNATVLLLGESGTGKELLARAVHNTSLRNSKPLIKVNCSAIPRELIESELFGHKKGSFTGAFKDKIGKFELANEGTLFLDEIGELPLDMQPKILRFLQEGEIEVVGGAGLKKLNVRVIAATNRDLIEQIEKKQFREDLYFRLNVFPIVVPPLRKRKDDIPLLVDHFVDKFNKSYDRNIKFIPDDSMNKLLSYHWPGNIRELENLIERASILSNGETLLVPGFESKKQQTKHLIHNKDSSLDAIQRSHILHVLEQCNWKISGTDSASIILDLKPSTLRDKMAKLGINKPDKK
ncbi:sigma 54-interacting transcriptional regulator [Algibacter sp. R77976]|uniref:sigma 54-interacting transcriptional regulator n=1 Tax=Algibacter sp. R77976 TaxID=3093873 RepID=UPI0037C56EE3